MTPAVQILTTTGARQLAFNMCCRYMARQTFKGTVEWIIVDDGPTPTSLHLIPPDWNVTRIRPRPYWKEGENTQCRNILAAANYIDAYVPLVIVEDDDWYAPTWVDTVVQALTCTDYDMVGLKECRKYNIKTRRARYLPDCDHSSLCSSGLIAKGVKALFDAAREGHKLLDLELWRNRKDLETLLFGGNEVVGLKGLPGRKGIDSGHNRSFGELRDPSGSLLQKWIGDDARNYMRIPSEQRR